MTEYDTIKFIPYQIELNLTLWKPHMIPHINVLYFIFFALRSLNIIS